MIEVDRLWKLYGNVRAVDGVSFTVAEGEIMGFLGPNGAGKTTTMRVLTGYTPATQGTARIGGHDVARESMQARAMTGYLPENAPVYPGMEVREFLTFMAELKRVPKPRRRAAVDAAIEECGLSKVLRRVLANLSKGFRQRVGLAQALLGDPPVLILDEPTVGLDPAQIHEIRNLIKAMAGRRTVVLSTHILPEVSMTCQKVVIIHNGRLVAEGTPEALSAHDGGPNRILATLGGPTADVQATLGTVPGVTRVLQDRPVGGGVWIYRIETAAGANPRAELARAAIEAGFELHELQSSGLSLEDVFLRVIARPAGGEQA